MIVAWQGWRIEVPDRWSPVKIEGDADAGYLLMADLHRPRLGIRWRKQSGKRFDAEKVAKRTMREEVGELEAEKALAHEMENWQAALLYQDPDPPGRDVLVGYSPASSRLFQVVYHAHHRERIFEEKLLPTIADASPKGEMDWSVFELSCRTPAGLQLIKQRMNAGDLCLSFEGPRRQVATVRQIAPAKLALSRRPIEKWVAEQASWRGRQFKLASDVREMAGARGQKVVRRRRFSWMFWIAKGYVVLAKHDEERNRLVIVDASSEELARAVFKSVGWARIAVES